ncbi:unnamed protein product [Medioppia subpectinata]|uniref:Putative alpha-L-fucosidase n=1 Tax=Medioppia subpectinata TaxID=1979941 RepID=A0A7R9KN83_9ACAR|nr:unnamed protein product [Medioppia subpectinata]CAG2106377.1 unnamed protein product [Medioppia subpectinata]
MLNYIKYCIIISRYIFVVFIVFIIIYCLPNSSSKVTAGRKYAPNWDSIDARPLPHWYDEAKVGIFIHWGVFSVPSFGSEWFWWRWRGTHDKACNDFMARNYKPRFTYADFAHQFTAEFYEPNHWAEIFKASGAKYVVLTAKHHEGYTLWPSKTSFNWNSVDIGPNRDLLGDLATAVRKAGLRFGAYHSWFEWFNPLYNDDKNNKWSTRRFVQFKARPELEELVNTYKPEVIWSDGDWEAPDTYWNSTDFLVWLYNESPVKDTVVVNDRWGAGTGCKHGGYFSCDDRYNPGVLQRHKWENAMTLDKSSWGFRRDAQLSDYLTTHQLVTTLAQTVSCGGNLLINIGPTHDGRVAPIFEERLRALGAWLAVNGESIYATTPWKHQNDTIAKNVWYTQKAQSVYAIALDWPQTNQLTLGAVDTKIVDTIQLLGAKGHLVFKESGASTVVTFPQLSPGSLSQAFVLKINTK